VGISIAYCRNHFAGRLTGIKARRRGKRVVGSLFAVAEAGHFGPGWPQIRAPLWLARFPEVVEDPELLVVIGD
jgi:hypothetical protein